MIVELASPTDFAGWRDQARAALAHGLTPASLSWTTPENPAPLLAPVEARPRAFPRPRVPKAFLEMAERAVCHRDPARFDRLYALLYRLQSAPALLADASDPDVAWLVATDKAIRRDVHKMHAFVRFRKVAERPDAQGNTREVFVAWFEPQHRTLRLGVPWFHRRFVGMDWTLLTPEGCASWNGERLRFAPGVAKSEAPAPDVMEDAWRTYYANIFNPNRLKIGAMMAEMPKLYWDNLPEAELIPALVRSASERERGFLDAAPTSPNIRTNKVQVMAEHLLIDAADDAPLTSLDEARRAAAFCKRCELYEDATQTVFGQGPADAPLMFVGEPPGDQEDPAGEPFVGPAGQLFNDCLAEAGIDRSKTYVTNAVKHFRYTMRGRRRIHEKPQVRHIKACEIWLAAERRLVAPKLIVCLGTTALRGVLGRATTLKSVRGELLELPADNHHPAVEMIGTVHPSFLLRVPDPAIAAEAREGFLADLRRACDRVPEVAL